MRVWGLHRAALDTRIEVETASVEGLLETRPAEHVAERSWNYVTLGHGHGVEWWRAFCIALQRTGYDDVLSIEHEDASLAPLDGVSQSVQLLKEVIDG